MTGEVDILLVEDSVVDAELITEALIESRLLHKLDHALDGAAALQLLRSSYRPHLVLLDLNLPRVSGVEVLKAMRSDPRLRSVPVVILTNSHSQDDIARCYANFCNAYIRKPLGFDSLAEAIKQTGEFWFKTATLPSTTAAHTPISVAPRKP